TRDPEVIDGQWHSVVHGQRQQGIRYGDATFPAALQAGGRDNTFYGSIKNFLAEFNPSDVRSEAIESGKNLDSDPNDKNSGKPIENGTQFVARFRETLEMVEITLGLPKGMLLAAAPKLMRSGGYERNAHRTEIIKIMLYCREKGWLAGVSEDEQGVLALSLALGYYLKWFMKVTAFESQPTTYGQVKGQDSSRYNTALALGADVLIPYEINEIKKWYMGKEISGTWKQKLEHLHFRLWYENPKMELAREASPAIFLFSKGKIKPYFYDPYFITSYLVDLAAGSWNYANMLHYEGYNKENTNHSALYWAFLKKPAMNQAFFFPSLYGINNLYRYGWQYGQFVVTALQKADNVPEENKQFLKFMRTMQVSSAGAYLSMFGLGGGAAGIDVFHPGVLINFFWIAYITTINTMALDYIKDCENNNPERANKLGKEFDKTTPEAIKQKEARAAVVAEIDKLSREMGSEFMRAYKLATEEGKHQETIEILAGMIKKSGPYLDHFWVSQAENLLARYGEQVPARGKMTKN
ncbi:MAG: hypothetical protein PHH14_05755, partial [Candidatus Margulisbacteria bacterium]|nr:hypothetical protein [Candidatus Margulisiibacteriota bacterium]